MFDRFTDSARNVMKFSREAAERLGHDYIGTEHILLGLLKDHSGDAAQVLVASALKLESIQAEVEKLIQRGMAAESGQQIPFTPCAKKVLESAIDEAKAMKVNYVGSEHLLLGLLRTEEGLAAQVLLNLGLKLDSVRAAVGAPPEARKHWLVRWLFGESTKNTRAEPEASWSWSGFDYSTYRVFNIARQDADRLHHDYIGTEHILLGLCAASDVLEKLGLDAKTIGRKTEDRLKAGADTTAKWQQLPFTPRGKRVLEFALEECEAARCERVACEHLLLALLREGEGIAAKVLLDAGVTLDKARQVLSGTV